MASIFMVPDRCSYSALDVRGSKHCLSEPEGRHKRSPARECWVNWEKPTRVPLGTAQLDSRPGCLRGIPFAEKHCAVPEGTRSVFPLYPALTRWATVVSPFGLTLRHPYSSQRSLKITCSRTTSLHPSVPAETLHYPVRRARSPGTPVRARTPPETVPECATAYPLPSAEFRAAPSRHRCRRALRLALLAQTADACPLKAGFRRASTSATTPPPGGRWAEILATATR